MFAFLSLFLLGELDYVDEVDWQRGGLHVRPSRM